MDLILNGIFSLQIQLQIPHLFILHAQEFSTEHKGITFTLSHGDWISLKQFFLE